MTCYRIPKAPNKRAFAVLSVKQIRAFGDFQAAIRYVDLRLVQNPNPAFCFNIQQTAQGWIVSRVL